MHEKDWKKTWTSCPLIALSRIYMRNSWRLQLPESSVQPRWNKKTIQLAPPPLDHFDSFETEGPKPMEWIREDLHLYQWSIMEIGQPIYAMKTVTEICIPQPTALPELFHVSISHPKATGKSQRAKDLRNIFSRAWTWTYWNQHSHVKHTFY